jgi:hypothetical protein
MARTKRQPPMMRLSFAVSSPDFERIRQTAQKKGVPYTVWIRNLVLLAVTDVTPASGRKTGDITLCVPFEIQHYDRLRLAAARVGLKHGELTRRALLHAMGKAV